MCKRYQDAVTHAGSKAGAHHGPAGRRHNLRRVGDVGILRQRFGIQRDGIVTISGHERHDGIAAEVSLHACLVGDMGAVRTWRFHQRDGVTERLAQGYPVRVGHHAALQTDVQGLLILILTDACAHFAVGRFVIGVDAGGVTAAGAAQPFLDIPVQVVFFQRRTVKTDVLRGAVFGVVQVVRSPGIMHPAIQRNRNAQRELVVVCYLITVFIAVVGVFVHAVAEAVAHAVPAVVVADAQGGHVLTLAPVSFLHHAQRHRPPTFWQRLVNGGFCTGAALLGSRPVVGAGIRLHGVVQGVKPLAVIAIARKRKVGA